MTNTGPTPSDSSDLATITDDAVFTQTGVRDEHDAATPEGVTLQGTPSWTFSPQSGSTGEVDPRGAAETSTETTPVSTPETAKVENKGSIPSNLGMVGRFHSPLAIIVLSIITGGIYAFFWHARISREVANCDPRMYVKPRRSVWALIPPYVIAVSVIATGIVELVAQSFGTSLPINLTRSQAVLAIVAAILGAQYLVVLFPTSIVAVVMTLERIRVLQDRVGIAPNIQVRPASTASWLLLPIVGGFIVMAKEQRRVNHIWSQLTPPTKRVRGSFTRG